MKVIILTLPEFVEGEARRIEAFLRQGIASSVPSPPTFIPGWWCTTISTSPPNTVCRVCTSTAATLFPQRDGKAV